jgi:hypothetical protein
MFGGDGGYLPLLVSMFNQRGIDPSVLYALNNNGGLGGNNFLWVLFLLFFWGGNGNWGGGFGGNNNAAGFLSNQISNDAGRDLLLQAIQGNSTALGQLASTLNSDFNAVQSGITNMLSAIQSVGSQVGMTGLQTINAIQAGNSSLSAQLAQCCCENRLLTTQQGYESRIATIEQTNQLGSQADRNTRTLADQIAAQTVAMNDGFCQIKERELQGKIDTLLAENTSLKTALSEGRQTQQFTAAFNILDNKITELAAKQPQTVPVQWPQITAVNTTPNFGPSWGAGFNPYGYGWGGNSYWG